MFIAITLRYEKKSSDEIFYVNKYFKDIFDKLGVTLIPIMQESNIDKLSDICDALILTGSPIHIDARLYKEKSEINYYPRYDGEDSLDYKLIDIFHKKNKPILGICRGIQVLNVFFGGTLIEKVQNHKMVNHSIEIKKDTFLSSIYPKFLNVNSSHTQSIKDIAKNFKLSAVSCEGIIEGIECDNIIGIQWHPERMEDIGFFQKFIDKFINKN